MSHIRLILASFFYHGRVNLSVACGVAAGTAVLTGALLVGDSMRGSLRRLTLDRLGRIDHVLSTDTFFRAELADELAANPRFREQFAEAVPVILLQTSVSWRPEADGLEPPPPIAVNRVNLIGCDERFWRLGPAKPERLPGRGEVLVNRPLADRLSVRVGDAVVSVREGSRVVLRLPKAGTVPADSLLGRKKDTVRGRRLEVIGIVPAEGLGRFSLHASQQLPLNAYVSLDLDRRLGKPGRVNTILVAAKRDRNEKPSPSEGTLQQLFEPTLDDYGLDVAPTEHGYVNITSDRMLLHPTTEEALLAALEGLEVQPALVYLANTIASGSREIPYSMIAAVDFPTRAKPTRQEDLHTREHGTRKLPRKTPKSSDRPGGSPLGPFLDRGGKPIGPLGDRKIVLNDWAADDLQVEPGASIEVTYFVPETSHGQTRQATETFELAAVVPLAGPAHDPHFTPEVPGVTDADSIRKWKAPFEPFHRSRVRKPAEPGPGNDEDYWNRYGTTPKAFVSLAAGRHMWKSRFGRTTSLRVRPPEGESVDDIRRRLALDPAAMGFVFRPVKQQGLAASNGTTSFSGLFLGFSFFVVAAAVLLVAILFRLGIDRRAAEVGILAAVGFPRRTIGRLLVAEGVLVAAAGSSIGVITGVGYAALMLAGLGSSTWWLAAIVTPFLTLHVGPTSLIAGFASGCLIAVATIAWSVRQTRRATPRALLGGQVGLESHARGGKGGGRSPIAKWLAVLTVLGACALGLLALNAEAEARAGAFFGAGALVLVGALAVVWARLKAGALQTAVAAGRGNLARMAVRNLERNPGRGTLTIGLVASAGFLIVSVSAFRIDPSEQPPRRESGNGGFALISESDQPIYHDLGTETGRADLGFASDDSASLAGSTTYAVRVKPGDDASCLNLYQPREPRILGLPRTLVDRGGFVVKPWIPARDLTEAERQNPWLLLDRNLEKDHDGSPRVPAFLDAATATYSLHLAQGSDSTVDITTARGQTVRLQVMGVLPGSIFQGDMLVCERAMLRHFPEVNGYRFFLTEFPPGRQEAADHADTALRVTTARNALERTLSDYGFTVETSGQRLARFLVVQNTYLSTFQSLGGLGLLLGTFGLGAVQLRSVLQRRRELALLRATGFRRGTLAGMVMLENAALLLGGLACASLASAVAVLPHWVFGGASIPWAWLAASFALVLLVGLLAGLAAVRVTLKAPLLQALQSE